METQSTDPGKNAYVIRTVVLRLHGYRMGDVKIAGTKHAPKSRLRKREREKDRRKESRTFYTKSAKSLEMFIEIKDKSLY